MRILVLLLALVAPALAVERDSSTLVRCGCMGNAADWTADGNFRGDWRFEERAAGSGFPLHRDASASFNPLTASPGYTVIDDADNREGCYALSPTSAVNELGCSSGQGCQSSDFWFAGPFTIGCWEKPDDIAVTRFTMCTDSAPGNNAGSGYAMDWQQVALGTGVFGFEMDPCGACAQTKILSSSFSPLTWHHQVGRFQWNGSTGTMQQLIDGVQQAATAPMTPPVTPLDAFRLGFGAFSNTMTGRIDECFAYNGALSDTDICRIAVCGVSGCGCECNGAAYNKAPLHSSFGGPLSCSLPACNKALPGTTTTSTSTTTSSSTSSTSSSSTSTVTTTSTTTTT